MNHGFVGLTQLRGDRLDAGCELDDFLVFRKRLSVLITKGLVYGVQESPALADSVVQSFSLA